jgi:hypothetical protein
MTSEWKAFAIEREREIAMEKETVPYGYHNLRDERDTMFVQDLDSELKRHWNAIQRIKQ